MSVNHVKNKPYIYGLTGGIATGKSTAINFFLKEGVKVFDSDLAVKKIWSENKQLVKHMDSKYCIDMNTKTGKSKLAKLLFDNKDIRNELNSLIHPLVFRMIDEWIIDNNNEKFLIIDMPLLFEVNYHNYINKSILIYLDKDKQIERLMNRDNLTKEESIKRINAQMDLEVKKNMADYIINNNKSHQDLEIELERLLKVMNNENKQ
ncbi:dephospho-CoA kinase [Haploplasma axanthum]|uniref:Dephospho-CoA kinase n=1 Tax=Haploplasma axanthum TaxID=29552 RepID=A0A449BD83_HAPAX|nr:dephospho-CoA kinase [Haploplasma axanthum]VEU80388.1 Dephospho-CoA kinase [Haploplasma axanthum]